MATLKQIAKLANLSIGTVSQALNDSPVVSKETAKRVKQIAAKLDYVPNNIGKALQSGKSNLIGFLVDDISVSFYNELLHGISSYLTENNYALLFSSCKGDSEKEKEALNLFRQKSVDGIIISSFTEKNIPILEKINQTTPLLFCDIDPINDKSTTIIVDDDKAAMLTVNHLYELGHKNIAYCYLINRNSHNRFNYLLKHIKKHPGMHLTPCNNENDLINLLNETVNKPTAVICYSDKFALSILHLLKKYSLNVPSDISVVGFDDIDVSSWPEFNLTTIAQPRVEMGIKAAKTILKMINKEKYNVSKLEPKLIIRKTTNKIKNKN